jgi:nucleoid-associated protein YgaU
MRQILGMSFILCLLVPIVGLAQEKMTEKEAQAELAMIQEQLVEAEATIAELESDIEALESEVAGLEARRDGLQAKYDELAETWKRCQYGRYTVVEGDWLCTIAAKRNVYSACSKWPMIYEANKNKIKNPNLIYPEWVLLIPYLDEYTVKSGDYLAMIASYLSIYSNARRWPEIYEANKDKIKDPDWIYPKQKLVIPHE